MWLGPQSIFFTMFPQSILQANFNGTKCQLAYSIKKPLFNPHENTINPCFLASLVLIVHGVLGLFALYQIYNVLRRNFFGPYKIKYSFGSPWNVRSVGMTHYLKANLAILQALLFGLLAVLNYSGSFSVITHASLVLFVVTAFLVLPLHVLETTRSVVGHASLLLYWLSSFVLLGIVLAVDSFSAHKVFIPHYDKEIGALCHAIEIALVVNAFFAYYLEMYFYRGSVELLEYYDLNGWDPVTVRNLISTLTFSWLLPMLDQVYETNTIELEDVPNPTIDLKSEIVLQKFRKNWAIEVKRAAWWRDRRVRKAKNPTSDDKELKPSLFFVLLRVYYAKILFGIFCELVDMCCLTLLPFLLQKFIVFFAEVSESEDGPSPPMIIGVSLAFGIYLTSVVRYFSFNQGYSSFFLCSYGILASLTALTYEKAMRLSPEARREKSSGDIVNHVSVDVNDVSNCTDTVSTAITIPLRLAFCLAALCKLLGPSTWSGLATAMVMVPLSSVVSTAIYSLYNTQMEYKDERTRLTSEILNAIKSIKLYSWEEPMLKKLDEVRNNKELMNQRKMGLYNAGSSFLWGCIPFAVSCAVYTTFALISDIPLVPSVIFPALSLFELLAEPILMLPSIFSEIAECKVALRRLRKFFVLDEMEDGIIDRTYAPLKLGEESVSIKNASFVWSTQQDVTDSERTLALKDISFSAIKGQLTCIVGKVGSGKTTLLKSMIGEVPLLKDAKGSVKVNGTIAYCSQNPWILNSTIKENILFGMKFDKGFYQRTVEACQLLSDFEVLPHGDSTLVGEKGISLSGGQKARLSLARALYSRADIYLLDDVLSAVDAHVGQKITDMVLGSLGMLATKTLILATNSVKILRLAKEIVFLKGGEMLERGSYEEIMSKSGEISALIKEFAKEEEAADDESPVPEQVEHNSSESSASLEAPRRFDPVVIQDMDDLGSPLTKVQSHATIGQTSAVSFDHVYIFEDDGTNKKQEENEEKSEKGKVKFAVYMEYLKSCNYVYILIWAVSYWVVVGSEILGNYVLKSWSEKNLESGLNVKPVLYLSLYAFTGVFAGILTFVGAYIIWTFCAFSSSKYFHDQMAHSVLRSPMSFFDTTPIGRILNRFSDDISVLDQQVLWTFMLFFQTVMETFFRLAIVIYNLPIMILVIAFLIFLYTYFRNRFIPASRELKRLQTLLRSPVFSHLQESVNGVETLRAYGEDARFIHANRKKVDNVTKVRYAIQCANRWLSVRLQSIAAIIVLSSSLLILLALYATRGLSPGLVGFVMTYVFSSTSTLNAIIRFWADTETKVVSIERLIDYGHLPSEADLIVDGNRPEPSWPNHGEIHFNNYSTRYREGLDPVLKNISLDIKQGEKIGIVGRTGAGKSSLTLALFRIIEATSGNIDIDSVDTSKIGLFDLRSQLNIIPQDAHAFEGTVRENLDPFEQYTDEKLWKVLEMAHLKEHVESMKTEPKKTESKKKSKGEEEPQVGLRAKVLEGGSNLSSGQRQLLCLARALLKTSKVLILDEATAAVDVQTDKIIQETIRSEFKDKTILTIAHRLDTIMDSDRILVLDRGEVREFDSPANLLKNTEGIFYSLHKEGV